MLNWDNEVESIEMLEVELSAMTPARDQHSKQTIHNLIRHILFFFFLPLDRNTIPTLSSRLSIVRLMLVSVRDCLALLLSL